ncbi:MAG: hypothetical protein LBM00_00590 [Deltaproteobacteria bacterium]|jgi:tetratricopeptide (TPR) repeat protein|nr:hypothetical protein [Deltaproteobacteria bacterium]
MRSTYNIFQLSARSANRFIYPALCLLLLCLLAPVLSPAAQGVRAVSPGAADSAAPGSGPLESEISDFGAPGREEGFVLSIGVPFGYGFSRDMAGEGVRAAARELAAEHLARRLAGSGEARRLLGAEDEALWEELLLLSNVLLLRGDNFSIRPTEGGSGAEEAGSGDAARRLPGIARFEYRYAFPDMAEVRETCAWLFGDAPVLENYTLAVHMEKTLYAVYAGSVEEYLRKAAAGRDSADGAENPAAEPESVRAALERLRAVKIYLDLLPELYADDFYGENAQALKDKLEEAVLLMPDNYLLLTELGRLYAWLEQNDKAGRVLNDSIRINPDFAQSYSRRGALLLLLRKHSLALADLDRAVSLSGGKAEYYYERAIIWRAMGDREAMCEDLRASCLAGNCLAHEWTVAAGECD